MNEHQCRAIAARLKEARRAAGLSQTEVAVALQIKRQTVSAWERAETQPKAAQWYELGPLYGVSLDWIVYGIRMVPASRHTSMDAIFARKGVEPVLPSV